MSENTIERAVNKADQTPTGDSGERGESARQFAPVPAGNASLSSQLGPDTSIGLMVQKHQLTHQELIERKIIFHEMADRKVLNSFRYLRTNLLERAKKHNFTVMVASVTGGGGGSFVARNLACAFALDERKSSILVDCDIHDPELGDLMDDDKVGLIQYLEDESVQLEDIIHSSGISRVRIIPSGGRREAPSEYFAAPRMGLLIEKLKERYGDRYIFIDGPPASESSDIRMLSDMVDYVLLVVPYGRVTSSQVETAVAAVQREKLVGIVFNDSPI